MPLNHPLTCPRIDEVLKDLIYDVESAFNDLRDINAELRTQAEIEIEELEKENKELKSEIEQLRTKVSELEDEVGKLQNEIEELEVDIFDLEIQVESTERGGA